MRLLFLATPLLAAPSFERDILPILTANCFSCHGGTAMAGLDLRTAASVLKGSHEGPVVVKGDPAKSILFDKVSKRLMPPPAFNLKLTDAQIESVRQWIEAGAPSEQAEADAARWREQSARFDKEALPVFRAKCAPCHMSDKPMAGLDLRTLATAVKGSHSGPVIEEGAADKSILIRQVARGAMPPKGSPPLTPEEAGTLRRWIDTTRFGARQGAPERTEFTAAEAPRITDEQRAWWAFRKPVKAPVPARAKRGPIDSFVLAKLESKGLALSPEAPMPTLVRRAYYDMIGLPPTPEQLDAALADSKPGAFERLVDRLLESPHYGERWGRHWLDAAGYSDAAGFDNCVTTVELHEGMWRYRDYVVDAFNRDKPYDRFLVEQLAGDELHDWRNAATYTTEMLESLTATGYLRSVYDRTDADIVNLIGERHDVLFHLMEKVSTHLMGLTMGCARCHTHKFDPIPQRDYYRMMAVFTPAFNPMKWTQPKNRHLASVAKPEEEAIKAHNAEIDKSVERLRAQLAKVGAPYEEKLMSAKLAALPESLRADVRAAVEAAEDKRDDVQKYLAGKFARQVRPTREEVDKALGRDDAAAVARMEEQIKAHEGYRRSFGRVQALWDVGPAPKTRLLQRGAVESPGPRVSAGVPEALPGGGDLVRPPDARGETTGMRLAFARWLAGRENALAARVMVNRVWHHHFGRGIVETVENFGKMGTPPTHPELLDWLAVDFMENGWSVKRLHRQIMASAVYRQQSRAVGAGARVDPDNRLLWRMNLKRLEAEAVRDGVLVASGKLDLAVGGKPTMLKARADGMQDLLEGRGRRSLYVMSRRNHPYQFLQVFDFPTIQVNCTRRTRSATPLQSLAMLNDDFLVEAAGHMAERAPDVGAAYRIALSRPPTGEEGRLATEYLDRQEGLYRLSNLGGDEARRRARADLCQMLLASNEFLYVD
jgi:mono/diheme cytochrome c family protein